MGVIIKKASELASNSTLVIGTEKSGKSVFIRSQVPAEKKMMYIFPASADKSAIVGQKNVDWVQIETAQDLRDAISQVKGYDVVVLEGLYDISMMLLDGISKAPQLRDWNTMSRQLSAELARLRDAVPMLYATLLINVKDTKDATGNVTGVKASLALNDKAYQLVIPLFSNIVYTYARVTADEGVEYQAQTNTSLAIRLIQLPD